MWWARSALVLGFVVAPATADAGISLSNVIFDFAPGSAKFRDVVVKNHDAKEPAYIGVSVLKVTDPGKESEKRIELPKEEARHFIATPRKFIIPPGGRKVLRLINGRKTLDHEAIYRVSVTPNIGKISTTNEVAVKIVIAYGILAIIRPDKPAPKLLANRQGKKITFTNAGNVSLMLTKGSQCAPTSDPNNPQCKDLPEWRLYPDTQWSVDLPYDAPLQYKYRYLDEMFGRVFE